MTTQSELDAEIRKCLGKKTSIGPEDYARLREDGLLPPRVTLPRDVRDDLTKEVARLAENLVRNRVVEISKEEKIFRILAGVGGVILSLTLAGLFTLWILS